MKRISMYLVFLAAVSALFAVSAGSADAAKTGATARTSQVVNIVVKSDTEHGKKGPDGKWHDAFLPASFTVQRGARVVVTVLNYDDSMHTFNAPGLHVNQMIMGGNATKPLKTTFTFTATKDGRFLWHCDPQCDPWAMHHVGFMRGYVTVTG